jgi:hypothetical protein
MPTRSPIDLSFGSWRTRDDICWKPGSSIAQFERLPLPSKSIGGRGALYTFHHAKEAIQRVGLPLKKYDGSAPEKGNG